MTTFLETITGDDELDIFFDPANGFAIPATVGGSTIYGILEDEIDIVDPRSPEFICRTSDTTTVDHGDAITIESTDYTIQGFRPDGAGTTILILKG